MDELSLGTQGGADGGGVGQVTGGGLDAQVGQDARGKLVDPGISDLRHDQVVPGFQQRQEDGCSGGNTRRCGQRILGPSSPAKRSSRARVAGLVQRA